MNTSFSGSEPMVRIDGDKIRRLRESKGLTQLYLATVVGVTTDTVSRWENRRYPTIKRDNALKLAEALEVQIEDILEEPAEEEQGSSQPPPQSQAGEAEWAKDKMSAEKKPGRWLLPVSISALLLLLLLFFWWRLADRHTLTISASRDLPSHTPPGQPFPVVITVTAADDESVAMILKETLPRDCSALGSEPAITNIDAKTNEIKWIGRTTGRTTTFAYMAEASPDTQVGVELIFNGAVTLKGQERGQGDILGEVSVLVNTFHWADANADHKIDDNEILTVYDRYSVIPGLDFDRERIDAIWAADGYRWDAAKNDFAIIP